MTLKDRFNFVKGLIETKGIQWYMDEVVELPDDLYIKDCKTRGVFVHKLEVYYADDCSLITMVGFK